MSEKFKYQNGGSVDQNETGVPENNNPKPRNVDFFGLKMSNMNDQDIYIENMRRPNDRLVLIPKENAYNKLINTYKEKGLNPPTPEEFDQIYGIVERDFANIKTGLWNIDYADPPRIRYATNIPKAPGYKYTGKESINFNPDDVYKPWNPNDTRFILQGGQKVRVKSTKDYMDERGSYIPQFGLTDQMSEEQWEALTPEQKKFIKERNFKTEIKNDGTKARYGDLEKDLGPGGTSLFSKGTIYVQGEDEQGLPIWHEKDPNSEVFGLESIKSIYGPADVSNKWYNNMFNSFFFNTIAGIPSSMVGFGDWVYDLGQKSLDFYNAFGSMPWDPISNQFNPKKLLKHLKSDDFTITNQFEEQDFMDRADNYWRNVRGTFSVKQPENVLESDWNANWNVFSWHGGSALGSVESTDCGCTGICGPPADTWI